MKTGMSKLPDRTVERLSQYRRVLLDIYSPETDHIFSYKLAGLMHNKPEQVRRDLMLIGCSTTLKRGYNIQDLISRINEILDAEDSINVAVFGMGNLGKAITNYFRKKREKLKILASFDTDPDKAGRIISGVRCYHNTQMKEVIERENITVAILTVPVEAADSVVQQLVHLGIKGIVNYTTKPLNVPPHVYLEEYDMITSLEKIAYHVKNRKN